MYKLIFELLKEPLGLPISPLYEYLLLFIINEIAFQIAWNKSPGGKWGSEIHWLIRIPTFLIIWAVTYFVIFVGKWLVANWVIVLSVLLGVITVMGIVILFAKRKAIKKQE